MSGAPDARVPVAPACATGRFGTVGGGVVGARSAGDVPEVGGVVVGDGQPVLAGACMSRAQSHPLMAPACATERSGTVGSGIVGASCAGDVPGVGGVVVGAGQPVLAGADMGGHGSGIGAASCVGSCPGVVVFSFPRGCVVRGWWSVYLGFIGALVRRARVRSRAPACGRAAGGVGCRTGLAREVEYLDGGFPVGGVNGDGGGAVRAVLKRPEDRGRAARRRGARWSRCGVRSVGCGERAAVARMRTRTRGRPRGRGPRGAVS